MKYDWSRQSIAWARSPNSSTVLSRTAVTPEMTPTVNKEVNRVHSNDSTPSVSCHIFHNKFFTEKLLRSCCSPPKVHDRKHSGGSQRLFRETILIMLTGLTGMFTIIGTIRT